MLQIDESVKKTPSNNYNRDWKERLLKT